MNTKKISVTYNGKSVLIESGKDKINLSKKLAFELRNTLSEFDNMYNFSGRDLTDEEWDELSSFYSECQNLKSGQCKCFPINDKDKEIALLNMFVGEGEFLTKQENGLIVIIRTPF